MYIENPPLKVVQLITRMDTMGGAQSHVRDISISLKRKGYAISIVTGGDANQHFEIEKEKIDVHYSKYLIHKIHLLADVRAFFEIRGLLKSIGPNLVATHSSKAGVIGRLAAYSLRIPVVFTVHGWSFTEGVRGTKRRLYMWVEKFAGIFTDGVISVSNYDRKLALQHNIVPARKIIHIHNGVHDAVIDESSADRGDPKKLMMVARFAPPKKQLLLLEALVKLKHLNWEMYFIGDGPEMKEAQEYAALNNIGSRVHFEGARKDVAKFLSKAHISILLSGHEGFPLSILESMRAGLPIIASDVGGIAEAVGKDNGFLIGLENKELLVSSIEQLIQSPIMQVEMGCKSRELYEQHFTFDKMITQTITYYKKVMGKRMSG